MRRAIPAILIIFFILSTAQTSQAQNYYGKKKFEPFLTRGETTWSLSTGIRNNKTDFQSASDTTGNATPNVFLQAQFDDITFVELKGKVRHVEPVDIAFINGGIQAEAELTGGYIVDGFNLFSAFAGDNRTGVFVRQGTSALEGDAIGINASVGYKIDLTGTPASKARRILTTREPTTLSGKMKKRAALRKALRQAGPYISVTPLVGYGYDQQSYLVREGFEVIPDFEDNTYDAEYITDWYGPFFGLEGEIKNKKHMLRVRGQYHDLSFDAALTDNTDGSTIENEADGEGVTLSAEYAYALEDDIALTLEGFLQSRQADEGTATDSFAIPAREVKVYELSDESQALRIGVRYNWD